MYNEVEVKAILIAVHNIENVGLNSKKVLLNSIEWLRCQYEITQDESFLIKAVWHIYAYLELGYPYISGELEFNRILNCLQLDINTVFPKKGWAYKKVALKKYLIQFVRGKRHDYLEKKIQMADAEELLEDIGQMEARIVIEELMENQTREQLLLQEAQGKYPEWNKMSDERLMKALHTLRDEERKLIYQHVFEERTFEEMSRLNGLSEERCKGIYYYAIRKIRKVMGGEN